MVKIFLLEEHLCSLLHQVVALGSRLILSVAPPGGVGDVAPPLALPYPIDDPACVAMESSEPHDGLLVLPTELTPLCRFWPSKI